MRFVVVPLIRTEKGKIVRRYIFIVVAISMLCGLSVDASEPEVLQVEMGSEKVQPQMQEQFTLVDPESAKKTQKKYIKVLEHMLAAKTGQELSRSFPLASKLARKVSDHIRKGELSVGTEEAWQKNPHYAFYLKELLKNIIQTTNAAPGERDDKRAKLGMWEYIVSRRVIDSRYLKALKTRIARLIPKPKPAHVVSPRHPAAPPAQVQESGATSSEPEVISTRRKTSHLAALKERILRKSTLPPLKATKSVPYAPDVASEPQTVDQPQPTIFRRIYSWFKGLW